MSKFEKTLLKAWDKSYESFAKRDCITLTVGEARLVKSVFNTVLLHGNGGAEVHALLKRIARKIKKKERAFPYDR